MRVLAKIMVSLGVNLNWLDPVCAFKRGERLWLADMAKN